MSPGSTVDLHSNCTGAELQWRKLSMSTDTPQLFLLQSRTRSDFLHDQLFSAQSVGTWRCTTTDMLTTLSRTALVLCPRSSAQLDLLDLPLLHDRDVHHSITMNCVRGLHPRYLCNLLHLQAELFISRRGDVEPQEFSNLDSDG